MCTAFFVTYEKPTDFGVTKKEVVLNGKEGLEFIRKINKKKYKIIEIQHA